MKLFPYIFVLLTITLVGCVGTSHTGIPGKKFARTKPENVEILFQEPQKGYNVIGFVTVDKSSFVSDASVQHEFQKEGAKLGAEAIIIEGLPVHGMWTSVQGKGKAVRWSP